MKFNKKLLVAVFAGTLVLGSGVSTCVTADNTDNVEILQEKVSVEALSEILNNVDKIIERLEKDFEARQLKKNPKLGKSEKNPEVEKLKVGVTRERAVFDKLAVLNIGYAIGVLRHFDKAVERIKQLEAQPGFDTKEKAKEAAKKDSETGLIKNAFDLGEKNGKWHYTLKFEEIKSGKSNNSDREEKTEEKIAEKKRQVGKEKKIDGLKNSAEKQKGEEKKKEKTKKKEEEEAKKKADEEKKAEEIKAKVKKETEKFKRNAEKKKVALVKKSQKVDKTPSDEKASRPVETTTDKKKLPKVSTEVEALTLATASLVGVLGVYTSTKKRK